MKTFSHQSIPNALSVLRLLLVPVIWALALSNLPFYVGAALIAAGLTDVLDGFVARKRGLVTAHGSRLDSVADTLIEISIAASVLLLKPEIFTGHKLLVSAWIAVEAVSFVVGWMKFRRIANLHLYLTKASGAAGYVFVIYTFMIGYNEAFFYAALTLLLISSLECLLLQLLCARVDEHMKSIFHAYRGGRLF